VSTGVDVAGELPWEPWLRDLLQSYLRPLEETGGELEIVYTDMAPQVWPLARQYRIEHQEDGPTVLWLRPIFPSYALERGRAFHLGECLRRGFLADTITVNDDGTLSGEISYDYGVFTIRPVSAERRVELETWDTFCDDLLTNEEEEALEELAEDGWDGGRTRCSGGGRWRLPLCASA